MTSTGRSGSGPTNRHPAHRRGRRGGAPRDRHAGDARPEGHNPPRLERDPDSPLGKGEDISLQPREEVEGERSDGGNGEGRPPG